MIAEKWKDGDKDSYLVWLASEIEKESATMPKFRRKSKFALPVSHRRMGTYKRLLNEVFGETCNLCGFAGRLEMAHLFYAEDSVDSQERNGRGNLYRMMEALQYPERFFRLCSVCHGSFDHARRNGGVAFLAKMSRLIGLGRELEAMHICQ